MRVVLALLLAVMTSRLAQADPTVETSCGTCSSSAIDGGCAVQPGVGSLASLAMAFGVLAVVMRRRREH